jgi:hypothetical protein
MAKKRQAEPTAETGKTDQGEAKRNHLEVAIGRRCSASSWT